MVGGDDPSTTGYGDSVPQTFLGRVIAGTVMIWGLGIFGLSAGILATGFAATPIVVISYQTKISSHAFRFSAILIRPP